MYEKVSYMYQQNASCNVKEINTLMLPSINKISSRIVEKYFSDSTILLRCTLYYILAVIHKYHTLQKHKMFLMTLLSWVKDKSGSQRSSIIIAKWSGAKGQINAVGSSINRCGEVQHFIQHIMLNPESLPSD